jgi:PIN domain nuclease of toxin-antitoxin system
MRILIDTQIFIWAVNAPSGLHVLALSAYCLLLISDL